MYILGPLLVLASLVIIYLCYIWMQSTRASQRRTEAQNQRVIELLEEQNRLLRERDGYRPGSGSDSNA